jgi:hypothetical protein
MTIVSFAKPTYRSLKDPKVAAEILTTIGRIDIYAGLKKLSSIMETQINLDDADIAEMYLQSLEDIPFERLKKAFLKISQKNVFFPKIAEIRNAALPEKNLDKKATANMTLGEIEKALSLYNHNLDADKAMAPIYQTLSEFSWETIRSYCSTWGGLISELSDQPWHFVKMRLEKVAIGLLERQENSLEKTYLPSYKEEQKTKGLESTADILKFMLEQPGGTL